MGRRTAIGIQLDGRVEVSLTQRLNYSFGGGSLDILQGAY